MNWADLETDLRADPVFPVEAPDGRKDLSEHDRQSWFVAFMRRTQPHIEVHANMNHGARSQTRAVKEGLKPGVFDIFVGWDRELTPDVPVTATWCEYKGYSKDGRPGRLSQVQIDWGNAMAAKGFPVACFFSARSCVDWLISIGAPIRGRIA